MFPFSNFPSTPLLLDYKFPLAHAILVIEPNISPLLKIPLQSSLCLWQWSWIKFALSSLTSITEYFFSLTLYNFTNTWWVSGATLGITDKMEARPQTPLLIPQARTRDERVRPCNSDLFFPLLGWVDWKGILRCLSFLRGAQEGTKPSAAVLRE